MSSSQGPFKIIDSVFVKTLSWKEISHVNKAKVQWLEQIVTVILPFALPGCVPVLFRLFLFNSTK